MPNLVSLLWATLLLFASVITASCVRSDAAQPSTDTIQHDRMVAAILTCGGGVFEYEGTELNSRYDLSVKDGAQILVSVAHRVGWSRVSQLLVFGDDGAWLETQFAPLSYDLKKDAPRSVTSAVYLLGQYARRYCTEHPFDTLADAIDNVVSQVQAKGNPHPRG